MSDLTITSVSIDGDVRTFEDPVAQARANTAYEMASQAKQAVDEFEGIETEPAWVAHLQYRGNNLGSEFTEQQKLAISSVTFNNLYVGDYWEIDNITCRIADINYWLNTSHNENGRHERFVTPHLVIVPDQNLYTSKFTSTNVNGGYIASAIHKDLQDETNSNLKKIIDFFGSNNIISHPDTLTTSFSNNSVAASHFKIRFSLMTENMVFGCKMNSINVINDYIYDNTQLSLFNLNRNLLFEKVSDDYWLKDILANNRACSVAKTGIALDHDANLEYGVRPVFGISG